jgi:hypothetical protein
LNASVLFCMFLFWISRSLWPNSGYWCCVFITSQITLLSSNKLQVFAMNWKPWNWRQRFQLQLNWEILKSMMHCMEWLQFRIMRYTSTKFGRFHFPIDMENHVPSINLLLYA